MTPPPPLVPARMSLRDILRTGCSGLRIRPVRVVLSALGIAIGIATMITVVGISSSSKADLMRQLDRLGTNMLTASANDSFGGKTRLPKEAAGMAARVPGVEHAAAVGEIKDVAVRRSDRIPATETSGIGLYAADENLLTTLEGRVASGTWLNTATGKFPAVVLGSVAAERLGITAAGQQVWIKDRSYLVLGIIEHMPLSPEMDRAALVGWNAAGKLLGFDGHPTTVYERSTDNAVDKVRELLPRAISPQSPADVAVSRPSDALAAKAAAGGAFTGLLLALGGVALLVGGVGVANTMVISVLERRHEVGLRRALGATRGHIRMQFLTESLLLSALGGIAGALLGTGATAGYAAWRGVPFDLPPWAIATGLGSTLLIGTVAGIYPAVRASRHAPTAALQAV